MNPLDGEGLAGGGEGSHPGDVRENFAVQK